MNRIAEGFYSVKRQQFGGAVEDPLIFLFESDSEIFNHINNQMLFSSNQN